MSFFKRRAFPTILALVLFVVLAVLFGKYDLRISQAVVNQESSFGRMLEVLGVLVAPIFATLAGITVTVFFIREKSAPYRSLKITLSCVMATVGAAYTLYVYADFSLWQCIGYTTVTFLLYAAAATLLAKAPRPLLYELMRIAVVTLFYLIALLTLVSALKLFWGRIRFRQLSDFSQFTPWYKPRGITGYVSFPSGHTANAAALYAITLLAPLVKSRTGKALCYIVPCVWIVTMAVSRVLVGAHYASDVLFGAGISIALFYLIRWIVWPRIRPLSAE